MKLDSGNKTSDYLLDITSESNSMESLAYVFNIVNDPSTANYVNILSMGHEWRTHRDDEPYFWDCRDNKKENLKQSFLIFQYTVSGEGIVEINGKSIRQSAGSAFLVERPGPYRYWLPEDSDHWELKFINFSYNAMPIWNGITQSFGRTISFNEDSEVPVLWDKIFDRLQQGGISNVFDNALYSYRFMLTVHKQLAHVNERSSESDAIQKCILFIEENFSRKLSLVDIAAAGELSPFYVNKYFKSMTGDTPMRYLTKVRIRYSMSLLYNTDSSIDSISDQCGFQDSNYFAKVFRKFTGISPSEFRQQGMTPVIL